MASAEQKAEMKLGKKLREIEQLESQIAAGESLDPLQLQKVERKIAILADMANATAGLTVGRQLEATGKKIEDGPAAVGEEQNQSALRAAHPFVACAATKHCPRMERVELDGFVAKPQFGERLCGHRSNGVFYNRVAKLARPNSMLKDTALESRLWSLRWHSDEWLRLPINLRRRRDRESFLCAPDVYNYAEAPAGTLVVDFANKHVGGGCFGAGFVQEEQMVMQSTDLAARLHAHRQILSWHQGISYEGVYMDAWWPRAVAAKKGALDLADIQSHISNPLTILAVDAPKMRSMYCQDTLQMLAAKVLLVFAAAEHLHSPKIISGLLGGGAFRNNRPLVLLLHLLLQPSDDTRPILFHHPVFWSFAGLDTQTLEKNIVVEADKMMEALRDQAVTTLGDALAVILSWRISLSERDMDLT